MASELKQLLTTLYVNDQSRGYIPLELDAENFEKLAGFILDREQAAENKARLGMIDYLDQAPTNDSCNWKGLLADCRKMVESDMAALTPKSTEPKEDV